MSLGLLVAKSRLGTEAEPERWRRVGGAAGVVGADGVGAGD